MTAPPAGSFPFFLYDALLSVTGPVARVYGAWDVARAPDRATEWDERLGRALPELPRGGVWIHGASVGEARLIGSLAAALRGLLPGSSLAASSLTRTGRAALPRPPAVDAAFFAPLDVRRVVRRVVATTAPSVLVLLETELWPNLVREAARSGARLALVNARLAPERMARYRRFASLYRPLLAAMDRVGASSTEDAARLREAGARAEAITVTGNLKYDLPAPPVDAVALRRRFRLPAARPVLVAGSTGEGEDSPVLDAFLAVRALHPDVWLVLAPRHPDRARRAAALAAARGLRAHLLSLADDARAGEADVLVVDALGELAALYALGAAAFVGGSLVPVGGHNVLEPAAAAVPVLFGPHTQHVEEPARTLLLAGAARRVADAASLAEAFNSLLGDAGARLAMVEAARRVLTDNRGALARTAALVASLHPAAAGRLSEGVP